MLFSLKRADQFRKWRYAVGFLLNAPTKLRFEYTRTPMLTLTIIICMTGALMSKAVWASDCATIQSPTPIPIASVTVTPSTGPNIADLGCAISAIDQRHRSIRACTEVISP